jgi:hypothetical protein
LAASSPSGRRVVGAGRRSRERALRRNSAALSAGCARPTTKPQIPDRAFSRRPTSMRDSSPDIGTDFLHGRTRGQCTHTTREQGAPIRAPHGAEPTFALRIRRLVLIHQWCLKAHRGSLGAARFQAKAADFARLECSRRATTRFSGEPTQIPLAKMPQGVANERGSIAPLLAVERGARAVTPKAGPRWASQCDHPKIKLRRGVDLAS